MKIKNLLKPTKQQIQYRNRLWAEALLENKKKARNAMRNKHGGRCCLQVAEDVAISCGLDIKRSLADDEQPTEDVATFFGWNSTDPDINIPNGEVVTASGLNDNVGERCVGVSHAKIAECVLNTFVHPSKKKWTFKL